MQQGGSATQPLSSTSNQQVAFAGLCMPGRAAAHLLVAGIQPVDQCQVALCPRGVGRQAGALLLQALAQELPAHGALVQLGLERHLLRVPVLVVLLPAGPQVTFTWVSDVQSTVELWVEAECSTMRSLAGGCLQTVWRLLRSPKQGSTSHSIANHTNRPRHSLLLPPDGVLVQLLVCADVQAA